MCQSILHNVDYGIALLICGTYLAVTALSTVCIMGFSVRGQCSNHWGRDNAQAEGNCIICL